MKKNSLLIWGLIIISFIGILCYLLLNPNKNNNDDISKINDIEITYKNFSDLNNQNEFFTLQGIINSFLESLSNSENMTNMYYGTNIEKHNFENPNFVAEKIKYFKKDENAIYLVKGYVIDQSYSSDQNNFIDNLNYEIFVNTNKNVFRVNPLEEPIESYLDKINYKNNTFIKSGVKIDNLTVSDEQKCSIYLSVFMNLLLNKPEYAYNILHVDTKNKYENQNNFLISVDSIFDDLTPIIFSYSSKANNNENVYNIIDDNQNHITIYEKKIMDFLIKIN